MTQVEVVSPHTSHFLVRGDSVHLFGVLYRVFMSRLRIVDSIQRFHVPRGKVVSRVVPSSSRKGSFFLLIFKGYVVLFEDNIRKYGFEGHVHFVHTPPWSRRDRQRRGHFFSRFIPLFQEVFHGVQRFSCAKPCHLYRLERVFLVPVFFVSVRVFTKGLRDGVSHSSNRTSFTKTR